MQVQDLVLIDGVRTPMAEFNGPFADLSAIELGARAARALFERSGVDPAAIDAIRRHRAAYLMAVGGAAYLVAKAIRASRVLAFADLGMEAIYEFDVRDMPVTVAVDANGTSVHETGPREWRARIGKIPVATA